LELTSCSKNYHMAGWRVGAVAGHPDLLTIISKFKSNVDSGMFYPIQQAAITALALGEDWITSINAIYQKRRVAALQLLNLLGCEVKSTGTGLFVWARIPSSFDHGESMSDWALQHMRIFITPGSVFGAEGMSYVRVSLCSPETDFETATERWYRECTKVGNTHNQTPQNTIQ